MLPHVKRNACQHVSDFDAGWIIAYQDCSLLYHSIVARVGHDLTTVWRLWNQWIQESHMEYHTGFQWPTITRSQEGTDILLAWPWWIVLHCIESRNGIVCQITSICTNNLISSNMDYQLADHGFGYLWCYTTNRNAFNGIFRDKLGCRNGATSCFQKNLDFVYSIMIVTFALAKSWRTWIVSIHSISSYWPITWSDGKRSH